MSTSISCSARRLSDPSLQRHRRLSAACGSAAAAAKFGAAAEFEHSHAGRSGFGQGKCTKEISEKNGTIVWLMDLDLFLIQAVV